MIAWIALAAGVPLLLIGILAQVANRRLYEGLRNEPYHREGDALAAYLPGCSHLLLGAGLLLTGAGAALLYLS